MKSDGCFGQLIKLLVTAEEEISFTRIYYVWLFQTTQPVPTFNCVNASR